MKFAHEFKAALVKEGFPTHWVKSAVPYGQLKKCIKKVESELRSIGLDPATLAQLIPSTNEEASRRGSGVAFEYDFDSRTPQHSSSLDTKTDLKSGDKEYHPKLTLLVRLEDGLAVDAALSTDTRKYLEKLASKQRDNTVGTIDIPKGNPDGDAEGGYFSGNKT
jgi:E3 ubiquitin-protein ligase BAH